MNKIVAPYTEIKEMYKNLKTNQISNFFIAKNSPLAIFPNDTNITTMTPLKTKLLFLKY